jgi:DNA-binding response OmpR family regulator
VSGEEILVVEDDPHLAHLLQHFLTREGYRVQVAQDGRAAKELLDLSFSLGTVPDLVLLDVHLPFADGFELLRHIRRELEPRHARPDKPARRLRVMMLTVQARDEDVVRGLELGAMEYLPKPFSIDVVCARVKNLLSWEPRG